MKPQYWIAIAVVGVLLFAGVGLYAASYSGLFVQLPEPRADIEARWERVQGWAGPASGGDSTELERALIPLHGALGWPEMVHPQGGPPPHVDAGVLPEEVRSAISELVAFSAQEQGLTLVDDLCRPERSWALSLMSLTHAALAVAEPSPDSPEVNAVLYLSKVLRDAGTLLEGRFAFVIYEYVLSWAEDRGVVPEQLGALRLTPEPFFALYAREAVCLSRVIDPVSRAPRAERLLLVEKHHVGVFFEAAHAHQGDLAELGRRCAALPPQPAMLLTSVGMTGGLDAQQWQEAIDRTTALLD